MPDRKEIIIRHANVQDSKKLSILYKQVYIKTYGVEGVSDEFANFITKQFEVERIEQSITNNRDQIIVAEYKNNLVGVIEIEFDKACPGSEIIAPEINKLYILEWFCQLGIGERLLKAAEKILIDLEYSSCWLWVLDSNKRAINFYTKHSYRKIGEAPFKMETNTYNNIVMLKNLITS